MATPDLHRTAATFATMLAFHCVRNSSLEDLHAGIFPSSKTGDYTDVKVVSPYGEIAWNRVSRISSNAPRCSLRALRSARRCMIATRAFLSRTSGSCRRRGCWP